MVWDKASPAPREPAARRHFCPPSRHWPVPRSDHPAWGSPWMRIERGAGALARARTAARVKYFSQRELLYLPGA